MPSCHPVLQPAPVEGRPLRARPRRQRAAPTPRGALTPHHAQAAHAAPLAQRAGRAQDGQELRAIQVRTLEDLKIYSFSKASM